jgi:hypothetical protein
VAGIRLDSDHPEWVRLFPVPFRDMETERFKKYDVVDVDVTPHAGDSRPESLRPVLTSLEVVGHLDSADGWRRRAALVGPLVVSSLCEIKRMQAKDGTSLGVFRPGEVLDFRMEPAAERSASLEALASQIDLFDPERQKLESLPYKFVYRFKCEDRACRVHSMGLVDWEVGAAYRAWRTRYGEEGLAERVRQRWFGEICGPDTDPHFFVGNVHQYPATFMLLGIFYPKRGIMDQGTLF